MLISVFKMMLNIWSKLYFFTSCVSFFGKYKNKKVKIHTLGKGQKNVAGAKTYFDSLTTTCKHFVVIVGSNDLTSGATVTQVHQDLQDLKELACIVKIQRLCPQYFTTVS